MSALFYNILFIFLCGMAFSQEIALRDIEQLTFPEMGFKKAGEAYFSPDGRMISFQAVPECAEDYQIYVMDLETRKVLKLSQGFGACTCSYFRPDGKKLIFAGSPNQACLHTGGKYQWDLTPYMNIYEVNPDGSDLKALTEGSAYHAECAYSPDGSSIVYASNEDGSMNLYVMRSDGTQKKQLTHTTGCYNGGPFFSPDGTKIIFRADRKTPHFLQIYMIDLEGENLVQLTDNEAVNWAPFWHPSGRAFVYTTSLHGHHNYQIYFQYLEGGKSHRVTFEPTFNGLPVFNQKGNKLLWTSKRGKDQTSQVFIADFEIPLEWLESETQNEDNL